MNRIISAALVVPFLLLLTGCEFAQQYDRLARTSVNTSQPLIGAYSGTWHRSERFYALLRGGAAKALITTQSDSDSLALAVELSQHAGPIDTSLFSGTLQIDPKSNTEFHGKLPLGVALVMEVNGKLDGDNLTAHYTITDLSDSSVQHENGTLRLVRVHAGQ